MLTPEPYRLRRPSFRILIGASAILVILLLVPVGRRAMIPEPSKAELAVDRRLDEVRFESISLQDALRSIASRAGVDISVNWSSVQEYVDPNSMPRLDLRDVTVRQAIRATLESVGGTRDFIAVEPDGPVIRVQDIRKAPIVQRLRLYDIERFIDADSTAEAGAGAIISAMEPTRAEVGLHFSETISRYSGAAYYLSGKKGSASTGSFKCGRLAIDATQGQHLEVSRFLEKADHPIELKSGMYQIAARWISQERPASDAQIGELNIENATLQEAVQQLQRVAPINVIVPGLVPTVHRVTLRLRNVSAEQAVDMILIAASNGGPACALHYREGGVAIVGMTGFRTRLPLVVYDVEGLINVLARGGDSDVAEGRSVPLQWKRGREECRQWLLRLIHDQVSPESWADQRGMAARDVIGNRLFIHQTPENHRRVAILIDALRREFIEVPAPERFRKSAEGESRVLLIGGHNESAPADIEDLNLDGLTITEALDAICSKSRAKFALNVSGLRAAGVDVDRRISLIAHNMTPLNAARLAFGAVSMPGAVSLSREGDDHVIWVQTSTIAPLQMYDVRDLVWSTAGHHSISSLEKFADAEAVATGELQLNLMKLTRGGGTWNENGGDTGVSYFAGRFFVNQTAENHANIARYLAGLRKQKSR